MRDAAHGPRVFARFAVPVEGGAALVAFTSRLGGASEGPFAANNLSPYVGDEPAAVAANRRATVGALAADACGPAVLEDFVSVSQVHGDRVVVVRGSVGARNEAATAEEVFLERARHLDGVSADAIVTAEPLVPIGVLTADCVPVCLVHPSGVVAVVHAGWKGIVNGIVRRAVETVRAEATGRSSPPTRDVHGDVHAFIGPAIGPCCYEVPKDRARALHAAAGLAAEADGGGASVARPNLAEGGGAIAGGGRVALQSLARMQLIDCGIPERAIVTVGLCTRCRSDLFFSYRRAVEGGAGDAGAPGSPSVVPLGTTGRQAAIAVLVRE